MNHYPRHIGDFVTATVGLSLAERGAYSALLDRYYADESPLPPNKTECYRAAGASSAVERRAVDYVLIRYFTLADDGYHNKRADQEIAAYKERANQARENGKHGGRPRNQRETGPVISGLPNETKTKANQEPVTNNHKSKAIARVPLAAPTDEHQRIAQEAGVSCADEWAKYRDWLAANGRSHKDEVAGFRNWLRRATTYARPRVVGKQHSRDNAASAIFGDGHGKPDERVIDGQAERVA